MPAHNGWWSLLWHFQFDHWGNQGPARLQKFNGQATKPVFGIFLHRPSVWSEFVWNIFILKAQAENLSNRPSAAAWLVCCWMAVERAEPLVIGGYSRQLKPWFPGLCLSYEGSSRGRPNTPVLPSPGQHQHSIAWVTHEQMKQAKQQNHFKKETNNLNKIPNPKELLLFHF